jgi:ComF family protein
VNQWVKNVQRFVKSTLIPPVCTLCGDPGDHIDDSAIDLCTACRKDLPRLDAVCARCAEPLTGALAFEALCGRCQTQPPAFNRCQAMFLYQPPVDHMLQSLKFNYNLEMARLLGLLMSQWLMHVTETRPDILIPVPLHHQRLRERGFNQAVEIARPIARQLGLAMDIDSCRRIKTTSPQSNLPRKERVQNVKGAFEVIRPVQGHVAIIDDVMTTGSTAHELAKNLLKAGADSVEVWVCARA